MSGECTEVHELAKLSKDKIKYLVMEASSHGLEQKRLCGLNFDLAIMTKRVLKIKVCESCLILDIYGDSYQEQIRIIP